MKALLLAAGRGERLKPLTDTIPKCMVPINGRPLLFYWLNILSKVGVDHFYINLHYRSQIVRDYIETIPYKKKITLLEEEKLLGTGGTLKKNAHFFTDNPFFLAHADNLCLTDFKAFFQAHKNRPFHTDITMMTFESPNPQSCGVVTLDKNKVVQGFYEKISNPPSHLANGAVFVMEPEIANFTRNIKKDHFEISLDILPSYIGRIFSWFNPDYHLDIGTPETYQKAIQDYDRIETLYHKFGGSF